MESALGQELEGRIEDRLARGGVPRPSASTWHFHPGRSGHPLENVVIAG
jgi:hypothetical protein